MKKDIESKQSQPESKQKAEPNRFFQGNEKIHSDTFKLEVAKVKKNISWNDTPNFEDVEHTHFFVTYDSNGRKMVYSGPTAGHSHKMEYWVDADGNLKAKCGPPVRIIAGKEYPYYSAMGVKSRQENTGRVVKNDIQDMHTHEVTYLRSNEVEKRTINIEAEKAKYDKQQFEAAGQRPLPQVSEQAVR